MGLKSSTLLIIVYFIMKKSILKSIDSFKKNAIDCSNTIYGGAPIVLTKKYIGMTQNGEGNTSTQQADYNVVNDPDAS